MFFYYDEKVVLLERKKRGIELLTYLEHKYKLAKNEKLLCSILCTLFVFYDDDSFITDEVYNSNKMFIENKLKKFWNEYLTNEIDNPNISFFVYYYIIVMNDFFPITVDSDFIDKLSDICLNSSGIINSLSRLFILNERFEKQKIEEIFNSSSYFDTYFKYIFTKIGN